MDPLSPYLFVRCTENLSLAISNAIQNHLWQTIKVSKNGPFISHLLFVGDVLLFTKSIFGEALQIWILK